MGGALLYGCHLHRKRNSSGSNGARVALPVAISNGECGATANIPKEGGGAVARMKAPDGL